MATPRAEVNSSRVPSRSKIGLLLGMFSRVMVLVRPPSPFFVYRFMLHLLSLYPHIRTHSVSASPSATALWGARRPIRLARPVVMR